ncbi:MAG: response regulator [Deltaproteobacteria bacterium]|nr:response regulator [Deltaproteobacteria bacterium]
MADGTQRKILVVDDEADMRIFVSTVVETSGYEALVARDGSEAFELALSARPDLVVLDVMMPKIEDGVHTYHRFKHHPDLKQTPIIMLSAIAHKTFLHYVSVLAPSTDGQTMEPEAYMEKPPEAAELVRLIGSILHD